MDGWKDILGVWIGKNESSKFWLSVLNDLKNRGVQYVYVFCMKGFREAIGAAYPKAHIQSGKSSIKFVLQPGMSATRTSKH